MCEGCRMRYEVLTLDYDGRRDEYFFQPDHGPKLVVPGVKLAEAMKTYQEQYRCSEERAYEIALKVEKWGRDKKGVFYYV